MPISVGEIEAVLTARDNMSPVVVAAAAQLQALNNILASIADDGSPRAAAAIAQVTAVIAGAEAEFIKARDAAAGAAAGISATGEAASQATGPIGTAATAAAALGGSLGTVTPAASGASGALSETKQKADEFTVSVNQAEGIATRMVERLLILAAIRGSFTFVEGIFQAADAMVLLSEKTDLSLAELQKIQYVADSTSVPMATMATAIDTFDKKLSETKGTTADALASIGLSFQGLFSLSADDRMNAVIAAIAALPTHLQRTAAEAKLFGTDAIDPLVTKMNELGPAAVTNGRILEDETIKSLAAADKAYRDLGATIHQVGAQMIIDGANIAEAMMASVRGQNLLSATPSGSTAAATAYRTSLGPAFRDGSGNLAGDPGLGDPIRFGDISLDSSPKSSTPKKAGAGQGGQLTGRQYVDSLVAQAQATKNLTDEQKEELANLKSIGQLNDQTAVRIDNNADGTQFTTDQLKEYVKAQKDADSANKAAAQSAQQLAEILAKGQADISKLQGNDKATGSMSQRLAAIDDETYAAQVAAQKRVGFTKDEWQAEEILYEVGEAKKQNLLDSSTQIENEILSKAAQDRQAITAKSAAGDLSTRVAAIDDEVYHEQEVAQRRLNNDEESWRTDYAIWQTGEARKQALIDDYNDKYAKSTKKLQDDLTAAQNVSDAVGLQKTDDDITARAQKEIDGLDASKLRMQDYFTQLTLIQNTADQLRTNAAINFAKDRDKDIIAINKEDQDVLTDMYLSGQQRELAINEDKRSAKLSLLKLEGKDTQEELDAEDKLYDDHAKSIIAKYDPILQAYHNLNIDMRTELAATWDQALSGTESFTQAFVDTLTKDMLAPFRKILAGMLADFEQILFNPLLSALQKLAANIEGWLVNALVSGASGTTTGGAAGGGGIVGGLVGQAENYGLKSGIGLLTGGAASVPFVGPVEAGLESSTAVEFNPATVYGSSSNAGVGGIGLGGAAGIAGAGFAGWELGKYLGSKTDNQYAGAAMGGAAGAGAGALIGAPYAGATFGLSIVAGGVIGAIEGWREAGKAYDEVKTSEADFQKQMGSTADEITNVGNAYALMGKSGEDTQAALHKLWDAKTPQEFNDAMQPIAQSLTLFEQNTKDLSAATTDAYGHISDAMQRVIDVNTQYGTNTDAVLAFQASQATVVGTAVTAVAASLPLEQWDAIFNSVQASSDTPIPVDTTTQDNLNILAGKIDDAQKKYDDMVKAGKSTQAQLGAQKAKIDQAQQTYNAANPNPDPVQALAAQKSEADRNAPELADIGTQVVGAYALDVSTSPTGSSYDALKAQSASISSLQQAYKDLGLDVNDVALKSLFMQNTILTGNPNLMAGVDGLGKEITGLGNLNMETTDSFSAQQRVGLAMYTQIQAAVAAAGGTTKDALEPMQSYLHAAEDEAKKLNIPLDDMTQQMIAQSKDAGIWQDEITPQATMLDAMGKLVKSVQTLVDTLNGIPPTIDTTININTKTTGGGPPETDPTAPPTVFNPPPDPNTPPPYNPPDGSSVAGAGYVAMAVGGSGIITRPTWFLAGEAGPERFAFMPESSSSGMTSGYASAAADLGPGASPQLSTITDVARSAVNTAAQSPGALNSGGASVINYVTNNYYYITNNIQALDAGTFAQMVKDKAMPIIVGEIETNGAKNWATKISRAMKQVGA